MKRAVRLTGAFLAVFLGLALGVSPCIAAEMVKVGIVLPLTGPQVKFGEIEKISFEMALEEINAAGGIKGARLELIIEADTGRPGLCFRKR